MYDPLKKDKGSDVFKPCEVITGDIGAHDLGLSDNDRKKLIEEVEYVFHSAATVRFDEPLKRAVLLNVRGTKLMMELAEKMKQLKASILFC